MTQFSHKILERLYIGEKKSAAEIAKICGCSENRVNYWIKKYNIPKRSVSEAIYIKNNPGGDPFMIKEPKTLNTAMLYGLGLGLYWGEGTKSNKHTVRLGNTDPKLIQKFIEFLEVSFEIDRKKIKFGLQIFSDMNPEKAQKFWMKELGAVKSQFQKVIVTPARGVGTYRKKTKHGVLTVHFNNKKLRDRICNAIEELK